MDEALVPPMPGYLRFIWLLFMQPITLHRMLRAWGWPEGDPSVWALRGRLSEPVIRLVLWRFFVALVLPGSVLVAATWCGEAVLGIRHMPSGALAVSVATGAALGMVFCFFGSIASGEATGVGLSMGVGLGVAFGEALRSAIHATLGTDGVVGFDRGEGMGLGLALGMSVAFAWALGSSSCLISRKAGIFGVFRLPLFCLEAPTAAAFVAAPSPWLRSLSSWLPHRHHDLIHLRLPGLTRFLVRLAEVDPQLAALRIAEASDTIAQGPAARDALIELQSRELARAASERRWSQAAALDLPFHTRADLLPDDDPMQVFARAAEDLRAATASTNQLHRQRSLDKARTALHGLRLRLTRDHPRDLLGRRLPAVIDHWLRVLADLQADLARDIHDNPQVPTAFVAGPVLTPDHRDLFKGRRDLARLIDHDFTRDLRAPIVLVGHRRVGKSSLLQLLPILLGSGVRVVAIDLKGLSGAPLRARPHAWLAHEVQAQLPQPEPPPDTKTWHPVRDWLLTLDGRLAPTDRLILALDEIEALQEGADQGWTTLDLLPMLRDLGDKLRRVRLLLVTARKPDRLGPAWVNHLITAHVRRLSWLDEPEARELLTAPIPDFPAIWPAGAVERVLAVTHRHPYLLQLVGDRLVGLLNEARRQQADDGLVEQAIIDAVDAQVVFAELWRNLPPDEQAVVRALAHDLPVPDGPAVRSLRDELHVEGEPGSWRLSVPMFGTWVRVQQGPP